jgi:hypothetical protein
VNKEPFIFLNSVRKHWGSLVTSGSIIGVLSIWQGTGHSVRAWIYWLVAILGFTIACFQTWNKQQHIINDLHATVSVYENKALSTRRALYSQLGYQYLYVKSLVTKKFASTLEMEVAARLIGELDKTTYIWAKTQAAEFYAMPEALHLDHMYKLIDKVAAMSRQDGFGRRCIGVGQDFLTYFEKRMLARDFDNKLFQQFSPGAYNAIVSKNAVKGASVK